MEHFPLGTKKRKSTPRIPPPKNDPNKMIQRAAQKRLKIR